MSSKARPTSYSLCDTGSHVPFRLREEILTPGVRLSELVSDPTSGTVVYLDGYGSVGHGNEPVLIRSISEGSVGSKLLASTLEGCLYPSFAVRAVGGLFSKPKWNSIPAIDWSTVPSRLATEQDLSSVISNATVLEALLDCGKGGVVRIMPGQGSYGVEDEILEQSGWELCGGLSYLVDPDQPKTLTNAHVVIIDRLDRTEDLVSILQSLDMNVGDSVAIVVKQLRSKLLEVLRVNAQSFSSAVFVQSKHDRGISDDLAAVLDQTEVRDADGVFFRTGRASKIICGTDSWTFVHDYSTSLAPRIEYLNDLAEIEESPWLKDRYLERAASLAGGVLTVSIGGQTQAIAQQRRSLASAELKVGTEMLRGTVVGGSELIDNIPEIVADWLKIRRSSVYSKEGLERTLSRAYSLHSMVGRTGAVVQTKERNNENSNRGASGRR